MSLHYNVVVSLNFKTEQERKEYLKLYENQKGFAILHKGIYSGEVLQKVVIKDIKQDRSLFK